MTDFLVFVFGLITGSFLNVCIYRLPRDLSVVWPRSACPGCAKPIAWYDNIPVLSYLVLKGRCRGCRAPIAVRYAVVEMLNAALWLFLWRQAESPILFAFNALFFSVLLAVFFTDLETGLIPDELSLGGLGLGFFFAVLAPQHFQTAVWQEALCEALLGACVGGGLLYLTGLLGQLAFRKDSMGLGDVKLLSMLGAFAGWQGTLLVFLLAPVLALPAALFERYVRKQETLPFGPYLALAGGIVYLWKEPLLTLFIQQR